MKSTKLFNNVSEELKKQIPKLKPKEVVAFQMLNGTPNPEPDDRERRKQGEILYPKVQLMTQFRIFDTHKGEYVDIVLADGWTGDTPSRTRCFVPGNENGLGGSRFQGKFQCMGGIVNEEELYEVLYISPQRKGTPCPDPSVEQIFEIIDLKAGNETKITKFDRLTKVIEITKKLTPKEARKIMRSLNQPDYQDDSTLLAMTKDFATRNVDTFLSTYENKDSYLKSDVMEAIAAKVIEHDLPTGDIKLSGTVIANIKVSNPDAFPESFVKWLNTSENGKDVLANIKAHMAKKQSA
jgi:hypothetical protein